VSCFFDNIINRVLTLKTLPKFHACLQGTNNDYFSYLFSCISHSSFIRDRVRIEKFYYMSLLI